MTTRPLAPFFAALFAPLAGLAFAPGCASETSEPVVPNAPVNEAPGKLLQSDLPRDPTPDLGQEAFQSFVAGNTAFVGEVYGQVRRDPALKDANLFFSPVSFSVALGMTYAGARGNTEAEMARVMRLAGTQAEVHAGFNRLDLELKARERDGSEGAERPLRFHMLNQLWAQRDFGVEAPYLDVLALNYGAGVRLVDFERDAERARVEINDWVANQTQSRIPELLKQDALRDRTVAVLTNAVYFRATWQSPFDKEATSSGSFWLDDGTKLSVPMMHGTLRTSYAERADCEVVELPYEGRELSMFAILPARGRLAQAELAASDGATLSAMLDGLSEDKVELTLPKFSFTTPIRLKTALQSLGIRELFDDGQADLSGVNHANNLYVADVIHEAFIAVDEAGTEAAAATAVPIVERSIGVPVEFDRPFLFVIRDNPTGTILFMGRVMDPSRK